MSQDKAQELPAVRNVPLAPNPAFTGRVEELDWINQLLTAKAPLVAIHGLGGIGKTQLVQEYAYRLAGDYDVIWWLRAEDPATLAADFADLGAALRLPGRGQPDQRAAIEAVRLWLAQHDRWLLVFDSVRDPRDLEPYRVPGAPGHVIVTSRHASWRGAGQPVPIRGLKREDSIDLLLSRSGAMERSHEDPIGAAGRLAEALGDLPLALAQAAAYIEESGITIDDYLDLFHERQRQEDLLRRGAAGDAAPTVATTWDIAFRDVSARSPAAAELLALCAFFAPDDIPRDSLREGADRCPPALAAALRDPLALGDLVAALRRYSLIEVQDDALSMHRLVQVVVRERLPDEARRAWAERAVWLVNKAFPTDVEDTAVWVRCKRWLPHARAVCERAGAAGVALEATEQLYHRAAKYARQHCAFTDAQELFRRAIALAVPLYGPDHHEVGTLYRGLARTIFLGDGDLTEARRLAERALAIHVACFGDEDAAVARDHRLLVHVCRVQKDLAAVNAHLEKLIAIIEQINGPGDTELISLLNDRGALLRERGDLVTARSLLERALALGEARYGADDPDTATFHSNLAGVLEQLGDFARARAHAERALRIGEKLYGVEHYVVAVRHNNLGVLLKSMGDLEGAFAELDLAVTIGRKVFAPGHRRMATFEKNLAAVVAEVRRR